jgi:integrase
MHMASLHRQTGKPNWFCAYSSWDVETQQARRHFKSTGTSDRREALQICNAWDKAARIGRRGKLTPDSARAIIAATVADVFAMSNRETLRTRSIREWCEAWLETKKLEAAVATVSRYEGILLRLERYLGGKFDKDIETLTAHDVGGFRDALAKDLSRASANLAVKTLRACLGSALKQGLISSNPASLVDRLKQRGESPRRPFTLPEIRRVLEVAEGSEWYGLALFGLYTGVRLSDLSKLTWRAVHMGNKTLSFLVQKTNQRMSIPLAKPLVAHLATLPAADDPDSPLFPKLQTKTPSKLSEGFRYVLADAGLANPPNKKSKGGGRNGSRAVSELSFHSLRHSFVSILKSTGANEAVAMALAGHETKAISQQYTSLDDETLRNAVAKLPDVTAKLEGKTATQ